LADWHSSVLTYLLESKSFNAVAVDVIVIFIIVVVIVVIIIDIAIKKRKACSRHRHIQNIEVDIRWQSDACSSFPAYKSPFDI
jgi:hypothetical protein